MGMAASQARFLSLTARKTNVEYEGQQVNQQRTALANESANLYNQLNSIEVPTPPATADYYKTTYTFKTNELNTDTTKVSTEYTLNSIYTQNGYSYARLNYTRYEWQNAVTSAYNGTINEVTSSTTEDGSNKTSAFKVSLPNGIILDATEYDYVPDKTDFNVTLDADTNSCFINNQKFTLNGSSLVNDTGAVSYSVKDNGDGTYKVTVNIEKEKSQEGNYQVKIGDQYVDVKLNSDGTYTVDGIKTKTTETGAETTAEVNVFGSYKDAAGNTCSSISYFGDSFTSTPNKYNQPVLGYFLNDVNYYISASELQNGSFAGSYYIYEKGIPSQVDYPCVYTLSDTGRYQSITITDEDGKTHSFDLDVANVQNEAAYKQAMLDYEYEQAVYNKKIKDINAKTEKIQQQDRTLELRLKQLDTEQNALKTEMDAVSKVIEDNIESTFKTFA